MEGWSFFEELARLRAAAEAEAEAIVQAARAEADAILAEARRRAAETNAGEAVDVIDLRERVIDLRSSAPGRPIAARVAPDTRPVRYHRPRPEGTALDRLVHDAVHRAVRRAVHPPAVKAGHYRW
jgi:hypothetical protein